MNSTVKDLLTEMISYDATRKPIKYFSHAFDELGANDLAMLVGWLLVWQKEAVAGISKPDRYEITNLNYERFSILFEKCPELKQVFTLYKDHLGWSETLSKEQQDEIRDYVHDNYILVINIRRDYGRTRKF